MQSYIVVDRNSPPLISSSAFVAQNGVLLRTVLDPVTGDLSDTRTRYLGSRPVKLFRVRMQGQEAVSCIQTMGR